MNIANRLITIMQLTLHLKWFCHPVIERELWLWWVTVMVNVPSNVLPAHVL